jgi:hypothetical protein
MGRPPTLEKVGGQLRSVDQTEIRRGARIAPPGLRLGVPGRQEILVHCVFCRRQAGTYLFHVDIVNSADRIDRESQRSVGLRRQTIFSIYEVEV